jgi:hypothetical protein
MIQRGPRTFLARRGDVQPSAAAKADAKDNVADFRPGDPMPWEPAGKLDPPTSGKVWRHEVFGGVYDLSKIRDVLVQKYGQDDPEAPTRGQSALFACTVDADGYLLEDSAVLSACAWAIDGSSATRQS